MADTTLFVALEGGAKVNFKTAEALCKYLNVNINKYFDIQEKELRYSVSTNSGIKTVLYAVLKEAYLSGYIESNFASKDCIGKISGRPKSKKVIYDSRESIQEFNNVLTKSRTPESKLFADYIYF